MFLFFRAHAGEARILATPWSSADGGFCTVILGRSFPLSLVLSPEGRGSVKREAAALPPRFVGVGCDPFRPHEADESITGVGCMREYCGSLPGTARLGSCTLPAANGMLLRV